MEAAVRERRYVLVRAGSWTAALAISSVIETMRPLPVRPVLGAPRFVRGLAVIRGALLPVVDLGAFLGHGGEGRGRRFVTVRAGARQMALLVDEVVGVSKLDASRVERTPPLLTAAVPEDVATLGALDGGALAFLEAARLLDDEAWRAIAAAEAG